jgi:acyl carrier protein
MNEKIKDIIYRLCPNIDNIYDDVNLYEFGLDSLMLLKVVIEIENLFSIHIEDEEIVDIRTINDISEILSRKKSR